MARYLALLILLAAALLATPVEAHVNDGCGWATPAGDLLATQPTRVFVSPDPQSGAPLTILEGDVAFYAWENSAHANCTADDSIAFWVEEVAKVTCNLDTGDVNPPVGGGIVRVRDCNREASPSATACISAADLDGADASTTAAVRITRGWWYLNLSTAVPDGDEAICKIQAERW